ncbi:ShlB/FhaC/HecB family hemolysin secretion/activation protein [Thermoleptolyngbya sichuanensis XZ-Cy5]|uniref:ShlB/FhaC/HecB family hemolysin secretion/activation protein n=1 Tax=Thermoleptolyngbya sichuanensis TaxID=2885951 RepID=UPI00240E21F7|nr:ShlB/FhaC/HecB family hemolysin secretion/activation protein [Thermoleptolyngbya sichuanensis]MDG2617691.1 ShlB/FhaC/HecB family hemolysin secretion/activation protein [Thermoleptolyngbya sichuanensis XZ-Cy5]
MDRVGTLLLGLGLSLLGGYFKMPGAIAQSLDPRRPQPPLPRLPAELLPQPPAPPQPPLPAEPLRPLPPPEELLPPVDLEPPSQDLPAEIPEALPIARFVVQGGTAFSAEKLATVAKQSVVGGVSGTVAENGGDRCSRSVDSPDVLIAQPLTFAQVLQARAAITQLYIDCGYISSGAIVPADQVLPQTPDGYVVTIQVIEGRLEAINVAGLARLDAGYVRSRLRRAAGTPLNVNSLLEGLQLLQLDPLIRSVSADLQAGTRTGTNVLQVVVQEADPVSLDLTLDNGRSPSVGSFRQRAQFNHANFLGYGDGLSVGYTRTSGSNEFSGSYTIPLNPQDGTLRIAAGTTRSDVVEEPFDQLNIASRSPYAELSLRQPVGRSPNEEFALGLTLSHQRSRTTFEIPDEQGFPSPGADDQGRTRVTALRFVQEWTRRNRQQVLAARSQFSLGLDWLDATVNDGEPDSRFFAWRGQGQWVRLLATDTLFLLRGDVQLTGDSLLALEQFGLGGAESVRGYRQDALLTDSGALLSAEVRLPILRVPEIDGLLQLAPFIDAGTVWNADSNQRNDNQPDTLVGVGLGLLWQQGDRLSVRVDWGIPLVELSGSGDSLQESGIYFSVLYSPF